jgi:hypothetical protein
MAREPLAGQQKTRRNRATIPAHGRLPRCGRAGGRAAVSGGNMGVTSGLSILYAEYFIGLSALKIYVYYNRLLFYTAFIKNIDVTPLTPIPGMGIRKSKARIG